MGGTATWTIPLDIAAYAAIESDLHRFLDDHDVTGRAAFTAQLVIEEIVRNLIEHTPPYATDETVTIDLAAGPDRVTVTIEDRRPPFDPSDAPPLDTAAPLAERSTRGMGLHLVRRMTDDLVYERVGDRNRLTASVARVAPGDGAP